MRPEVEQAIATLQRGEPGAAEQALALLQDTVFSFSMKVCGQREDAEDTMQETLLQAMRKLPSFSSPKALAVWLYKVAKSRCLMSRRRSKFAPREHLSIEVLMPDRKQLERLATEDDLTHLKNRRYIRQFLTQILEYARTDNFHVTLLLFDIDNFKHYNDQYGHAVGDAVLYQVGQMMKRCCRSHDVVARVGGDEFAVVFWDLPSEVTHTDIEPERRKSLSEHPKETVFMSERFRLQLSKTQLSCLGACGKGHLTISGGLASFPKDGWDMKQLFEQADRAMLQAKRSGKNRIHIVGASDEVAETSNQTDCIQ